MKLLLRAAMALASCLVGLESGQAQEVQSALSNDPQEILHVLNRITFGPRPGDVEAVQRMGLQNFIAQQLHPETIDDSATESEVAQFQTLQLSDQQLYRLDQQYIRKVMTTQKARATLKANGQAATSGQMPAHGPGHGPPGGGHGPGFAASDTSAASGPGQDQDNHQNRYLGEDLSWNPLAVIGQIEKAKLVRAVNSPRQLQEVLVDFWSNHFNIDISKGQLHVMKVADDRDVIRPHILGKFRDLLEASAMSPAMLLYLDNAKNSASQGNENYGREIMELHTLGIDGGYTQKDVQEVARCFTGWTLNHATGGFHFDPNMHDNGVKTVLGQTIPANGGMADGEKVLDILCASPATAHHISLELCQRFVSDAPPEALVQRIAQVFQSTNGDLRQVMAAILSSPEFLSPSDYGTKIKSPLEFAVSAVRATSSRLVVQPAAPYDMLVPTLEGSAILGRKSDAVDKLSTASQQSLNWRIYKLGEPLFACTPPTGYPETSRNWVNPGALIERLNFSMALTQKKIWDVAFDAQKIIAGADLDQPEAVLDRCIDSLLQGNVSTTTRALLTRAALPAAGQSQTVDPTKLIGLILGSPEFQRK